MPRGKGRDSRGNGERPSEDKQLPKKIFGSSLLSSSMESGLTSEQIGIQLAITVLDELRPSDFSDLSNPPRWATTIYETSPERKELGFQAKEGWNFPKYKLFPDLASNPSHATPSTEKSKCSDFFCMAHVGFVPSSGNLSIEHAYPYASIRDNQDRLLRYLNSDEEIRIAFMNFQSGIMRDYFQYNNDILVGNRRFYMYSYNAMRNIYLLCTGCNSYKSDTNPLPWLQNLPFFKADFEEYVRKEYGAVQCGLLFSRAFKEDEAIQLELDGEIIFLPRENAPGLGELIRNWFSKVDKAILDIHAYFHINIFNIMQDHLQKDHDWLAAGIMDDNQKQVDIVQNFIRNQTKEVIQMFSALQKQILNNLAEELVVKITAPPPPSMSALASGTSSSSSGDETLKMKEEKTNYITQPYIDRNLNAHYIKHICRRAKYYYVEHYCKDKPNDKAKVMGMIEAIQRDCFDLDKQQGQISSDDWKAIYNYTNTFFVEEEPSTLEAEAIRIKKYLTNAHKKFLSQYGRVKELTEEKEELTQKLGEAKANIKKELDEINSQKALLEQSFLDVQSQLQLVESNLQEVKESIAAIDSDMAGGKLDFKEVGVLFSKKGQLEEKQINLKEKIDGLKSRIDELLIRQSNSKFELAKLDFSPSSPHEELDSPSSSSKYSPIPTMEIEKASSSPALQSISTFNLQPEEKNTKSSPSSHSNLSQDMDVSEGASTAKLLANSMKSVVGSLKVSGSPPHKRIKSEHSPEKEEQSKSGKKWAN